MPRTNLYPVAVVFMLCAAIACAAQNGKPGTVDSYDPPTDTQGGVAPPTVKQAPHTARITGTVLCSDTHRPARGAMVMVSPIASSAGKEEASRGTEAIVRVASDGTYTADHLAAAEYSVIAMLPGYLSPMDDMPNMQPNANSEEKMQAMLRKAGTVAVRANETGHFDLNLRRGAAVSGRVLYSDGSPASQVTLDVQDVNASASALKDPEDTVNVATVMRTFFMHQSQGTDDQGHFRISGIVPGTYRVGAVQAAGNPMSAGGIDGTGMAAMMGLANPKDLRFYSGDTIHSKAARTYELRTGDEVTGIDIVIPVEAVHRVRGHVAAKDGRAVNAGSLNMVDVADDTLAFSSQLEADGAFLFSAVPSGTYQLTVTNARIGTIPADMPDIPAVRESMLKASAAFSDGNTSVVVKEADVADINLALTEVPLPPDADTSANDASRPGAKVNKNPR